MQEITPPAWNPDGRTMRVLIVDDDPELLLTCGLSLAQGGHRPTGAMEAGLGLAVASQERVGAILVNTRLAGAAPAWFLVALRRDKATSSIPLLLYSTDPSREEEVLAWQIGADAYLTSFREPEVLSSVIELVSNFEPGERIRRRRDALARLATAPPHPAGW
jgi:twitching motility two-component system response regulator PilH